MDERRSIKTLLRPAKILELGVGDVRKTPLMRPLQNPTCTRLRGKGASV
jgi:hypothetical protein